MNDDPITFSPVSSAASSETTPSTGTTGEPTPAGSSPPESMPSTSTAVLLFMTRNTHKSRHNTYLRTSTSVHGQKRHNMLYHQFRSRDT